METNLIAIDVKLAGQVTAGNTAYLDPGDDIIEVLKDISKTKTIIGFEWDGNNKFGVLVA